MPLEPSSPLLPSRPTATGPTPVQRGWPRKFSVAFRGLKLGIRGQSSFFVHFFFMALVITAAVVLRCGVLEWCALLGCIGFVLVAELFNSALETFFRALDEETRPRAWPALDIAAGAVLLASTIAVLVGSLIFISRLWAIIFTAAG